MSTTGKGLATARPGENAAVTLWRCSRCGKWSHAKRRPLQHEAFLHGTSAAGARAGGYTIRQGGFLPDGEVHTVDGGINFDGGVDRLVGTQVYCGPFDEWRAEKVA